MKKVVISLVTLSSIVLLAACGQSNTASTSSSSSSKAKTSQTSASSSSKAKSESSKATSQETAAGTSAESSAVATSETSASSSASAPAESQPAAKNVADVASFAGTWANDLGYTVTVNADGSVVMTTADGEVHNMALKFNHDTQGSGFYTIYVPESPIGSAAFIYIPANVTNPHIGTTDARETLVIGQDVSADEHPYYRQ